MANKEPKGLPHAASPAIPDAAKAPVAPVAKTPAAPASKSAASKPVAARPIASKPAPAKSEPITPVAVQPAAGTTVAPVVSKATTTPPPAPMPAAIIEKEAKVMEATINTATDKTQAMFADANDRAKNAMDKGTRLFEDMNEYGKGNIEAIVESSKIAVKGFETMGQDAAEYTRKSLEGATAALRSLASVKSPTEFFKLQSEYVRQSFDSMVAETSKNTEAMVKLAGAVAQPISNRVAVAADKAKIAA